MSYWNLCRFLEIGQTDDMLSPQTIQQQKSVRLVLTLFLFGLLLGVMGTPLPATAATGQLASSAIRLKYGWVAVGTSETQVLVLTNTGSAAMTISGVRVTGEEFKVSGGGFPKSLAAGASTTVNVIFSPTAPGWVSRQLTFNSNASNPGLSVSVRGTGVKKEPVSASPDGLSFGQVPVGTTAKLTVNLTNNCLCTQTLSALQIVNSAFAVTSPTLPITLSRGQTVKMTVTFTPPAAGVAAGSVMVDGPYVNVPLTGTGAGTTVATLNVTPGSLNFGSVSLGTTATQTSTLSATGGPVTVNSAAVSNAQFTMSGISLPVTIPSGQSVSLKVVFTPKSAGAVSANLSFASTASNTKATEALAGTATNPYVTLSWSPSTSNVAGYNVYRSTSSSGPFSRLNSALDKNTTFVDSSVGVGNTYFYATTAVNANGQESTYSNLAQVNVP
jgi:hypothetical protein